MTTQLLAVAIIAIGLLVVERGIAVQRGSNERFRKFYADRRRVLLVRTLPIVSMPLGMALVLAGAGLFMPGPIGGYVFFLGLFVVFALTALAFRPPDRLKPTWLRCAESSGQIQAPRGGLFDLLLLAVSIAAAVACLVALPLVR